MKSLFATILFLSAINVFSSEFVKSGIVTLGGEDLQIEIFCKSESQANSSLTKHQETNYIKVGNEIFIINNRYLDCGSDRHIDAYLREVVDGRLVTTKGVSINKINMQKALSQKDLFQKEFHIDEIDSCNETSTNVITFANYSLLPTQYNSNCSTLK